MAENRLIQTLKLTNFLSYGPESDETELESLNVLIGPNASGKSNLIEAIALLRATPHDLNRAVVAGGGVNEWLWKGAKAAPTAEIEATVCYPAGFMPLRYRLSFGVVGQSFEVVDEAIENERPRRWGESDVFFYYRYQRGHPVLSTMDLPSDEADNAETSRTERHLRHEDIVPSQSVLSQRRDPDLYPEVTYLGRKFEQMRLYTELDLGRRTAPRRPQATDMPHDFLEEDASNLVLVLNHLEHRGQARDVIVNRLREFYAPAARYSTKLEGGTAQLFLHEDGLRQPVPATRLSDGTLRYLALLSVLCHPDPPPLVCLEEPELGLHPDIIPSLAELLVGASQRTQLIVTTHSDVLVSALTGTPDAVLVCERDDRGTHLRRLDADRLAEWLERYTLGELWTMGELGGTRW